MKMELIMDDPAKFFQNLADAYPKVALRALNKTGEQLRTAAKRDITDRYNVPSSEVRDLIRFRSHPSDLSLEMYAKSSRLAWILFGPRFSKRTKGVSIEIIRGRRKTPPGAFAAQMHSGHIGIFTRTGTKAVPQSGSYVSRMITRGPRKGQAILREKIKERYTISAAKMFGTQQIFEKLHKMYVQVFAKVFEQELNFEKIRKD